MDLGKYVGTVFVDLKKAFDTVDHSILVQKLDHYWVKELDLQWFQSYLSSRKQFTRIDGGDSSIKILTLGFPKAPVWVLCYSLST